MPDKVGSAVFSETVAWTLRNPRSKETRTYEQSELTIEGEARLLALVQQTARTLSETAFPWEKLAELFDPTRTDIDWVSAAEMLGIISAAAPDTVAEGATILLNIYPTNEDGSRNPNFDDDRRFLKSSLSFTRFVDLIKTFAKQNDYQRLTAPFGKALEVGAAMGRSPSGT